MEYKGQHSIFPADAVQTQPLSERTNKVSLADLVMPAQALGMSGKVPDSTMSDIRSLADDIKSHRAAGKPVILFTGAHLVKNGMGPLVVDLVRRDLVTLVAGNGATAIHDVELALIGETSEYVPDALSKGLFGMAYEFAYINAALSRGNSEALGYGESLGRMICDSDWRNGILAEVAREGSPTKFEHSEVSMLAACFETSRPMTIHAGIGVDVIDQHASFDGEAKGGCSGRDFLIYVDAISKLTDGGVVLNIGSAVQGPEVLLKAVSMASNTGHVPHGIVAADFDIRPYEPAQMTDETSAGYYYRDQKSVATRVPEAFGGKGCYVQGDQNNTIPALYRCLVSEGDER